MYFQPISSIQCDRCLISGQAACEIAQRCIDKCQSQAERKLDFREVERGIWSAGQAKARFAEAWLWLNEAGVELLPLERYTSSGMSCENVWKRSNALPSPI